MLTNLSVSINHITISTIIIIINYRINLFLFFCGQIFDSEFPLFIMLTFGTYATVIFAQSPQILIRVYEKFEISKSNLQTVFLFYLLLISLSLHQLHYNRYLFKLLVLHQQRHSILLNGMKLRYAYCSTLKLVLKNSWLHYHCQKVLYLIHQMGLQTSIISTAVQ